MSSILDVAVMSPNRYFCLGLSSLQEQKSLTAIRLHFCHDLKSLKTLMESMEQPFRFAALCALSCFLN